LVLVIAVLSAPRARKRKLVRMVSALVTSPAARSASAMINRASSPEASRMWLAASGYLSCSYNGTLVTLLSPLKRNGTRGSVMLM